MRRRTLLALIAVGVTTASWDARAAPPARGIAVAFSFEGCGEALVPELERIARIELHAPTGAPGPETTVVVACDGEAVALKVVDALTSKRVERSVSLSGVAQHDRARLLALSIAELARSSWLELEVEEPPALPIVDAVKVPDEAKELARTVALPARPSRWRAFASVEGLVLPTVGRPLLGVSLGAQREAITASMFVEGAISAWEGVASRSSGDVTVRQLAIDPALGVRFGPVDLALAVRLGWASLFGSPNGASLAHLRGDSTTGLLFGSHLAAGVGIAGPVRLWGKAGGLWRGQRGTVDGDSDVIDGGFYASLGLGLALGL